MDMTPIQTFERIAACGGGIAVSLLFVGLSCIFLACIWLFLLGTIKGR